MSGPSAAWRPPSAEQRCDQLLQQWRGGLRLDRSERTRLAADLAALDDHLGRLERRELRIAAVGRVGVGKSSLLNALLGTPRFHTDVAHGSTRTAEQAHWSRQLPGLGSLTLIDTPGIDEVDGEVRELLARSAALGAELVLFVLDGDLSAPERLVLEGMLGRGQPVLPVLNRLDIWPEEQREQLMASLRKRLPRSRFCLEPVGVMAAPRRPALLEDGRVRSEPGPPDLTALLEALLPLLEQQGALLLALNCLQAADRFHGQLHRSRLRRGQRQARGLIQRVAGVKAAAVAANPLLLLDLAGTAAMDATLVLRLCRLYGLDMDPAQARRLLRQLSGHGLWLGGAQLGLQTVLSLLRQLLTLAAPVTGGLSLAPAAPVAMAQAALAVHTTHRTGRLAAEALRRNASLAPGRPGALMRRLWRDDPQARRWLSPPVRRPAAPQRP
ncbi:DUF697 domain-containing protein [Synechococcus sp. RSCCF101]|uniref:GTP-binding protein n=1 Tax=Synechococcus sp. RSCCF101 TaxID=2511069 RepID=UPI0012459CF8|nr:GTP-binding protein [Synechococcus sp. RSCCF101]QEY33136.1 DUF697 domain-containing protein [Synechococcus sp. RSCCF101]